MSTCLPGWRNFSSPACSYIDEPVSSPTRRFIYAISSMLDFGLESELRLTEPSVAVQVSLFAERCWPLRIFAHSYGHSHPACLISCAVGAASTDNCQMFCHRLMVLATLTVQPAFHRWYQLGMWMAMRACLRKLAAVNSSLRVTAWIGDW